MTRTVALLLAGVSLLAAGGTAPAEAPATVNDAPLLEVAGGSVRPAQTLTLEATASDANADPSDPARQEPVLLDAAFAEGETPPAWLEETAWSAGPEEFPALEIEVDAAADAEPADYTLVVSATDSRGLTTQKQLEWAVLPPLCGGALEFELDGACATCPTNHLPDVSKTGCVGCPAGTERTGAAAVCTACPAGLTSVAGASCRCGPAERLEAGACVACPAHTDARDNPYNCAPCPAGHERPVGAPACRPVTLAGRGGEFLASGTTPLTVALALDTAAGGGGLLSDGYMNAVERTSGGTASAAAATASSTSAAVAYAKTTTDPGSHCTASAGTYQPASSAGIRYADFTEDGVWHLCASATADGTTVYSEPVRLEVDATAPSFKSAGYAGTTVTVTASEPVWAPATAAAGDFTVTDDGEAATVSARSGGTSAGAADETVTLTVAPSVASGSVLSVAYAANADASLRLRDAAGNELASGTIEASRPTITVSVASPTLAEDAGDVPVRLTLQNPPASGTYSGCKVRLAAGGTADAADVTFKNQKKLRSDSSPPWTAQAKLMAVVDDDAAEGDETLVIEGFCSNSDGGTVPPAAALISARLTLVIDDDENSAPAFAADAAAREVAENAATGTPVGAAITATDPDGDDLTYTLTDTVAGSGDSAKFTVGADGQIAVAADAMLDHETQPSHAVTVSVSDGLDGDGNADPAADDTIAVTIGITDVNESPTANAGADQAADEDATVTLDGSGSSDPDGDALSYAWTAPAGVNLSDTTMAAPTFTAPNRAADYDLVFSLTVSDGTLDSAADTVTVSVIADNDAPTCPATASFSLAENPAPGTPVGTLVCTDPDGATLAYTLADTVAGSGDAAKFTVGADGQIAVAAGVSLDYETQTTHAMTATASDGALTDSVAVTVTVTNVLEPTIVLSVDSTTLSESAGEVQVRLTLEDPPETGRYTGCKVRMATGGTAAAADVTFKNQKKLRSDAVPPWTARAKLMAIVDDEVAEDDETLVIEGYCSNSQAGTDPPYSALLSTPLTLTVVDDDRAALTVAFGASKYEATEGGTAATVSVTMNPASDRALAVPVTTDPAAGDFALSGLGDNGQIAFATGDSSKTFTVAATEDADSDDETVTLGFGTLPGGVSAGTTATSAVALTDNDPATTVSIADVSVAEGDSGTKTVAFAVSLNASSSSNVTVDYATADGTATTAGGDYESASGTLTINAGATSGTVSVTVNGDEVDEADETFTVALSNPSNAKLGDAEATGTITDDDTRGVTVTPTVLTIGEGGSGTYTVVLDSQPTADVTVTIASDNGDVTANPASLTFTTGNRSTPQTVTVTAGQDDDASNDAAAITHGVSGGGYGGVSAPSVSVTVDDDETANNAPSFGAEAARRSVAENAAAGTTVGAPVTATDADGDTLYYSLSGGDAGSFDIGGQSGQITVKSGAALDHEARPSLAVTVGVSDRLDGTGAADTAVDDEIDVTVDVADVNEAPTADAGEDQPGTGGTINEGGTVTLDGSGSSDPEGRPLTYLWSRISGPAVTLSDAGAAGPTFAAPDRKADYSLTFSLTVSDDGTPALSSEADEVEVAVTADNDAPTEDQGIDDQTGTEGAAFSFYVPADAFADEPDDTLAYTATGLPSGIAVSGAGEFSGTPAQADVGGHDVTVTATDTGSNTATTDFTLTVADAYHAPAFDADTATRSVAENAPAGTSVGAAVTATDADGDTLYYSLSGADAGSFEIGGQTGQITVKSGAALDHEAKPSLAVTVGVSDRLDDKGEADPAVDDEIDVTVDVNDVNEAPTASAGDDQTATEGATVTLDGSGSSDPDDGDTVSYAWSQTDGPDVTLSDASAAGPTFAAPDRKADYSLTFSLTVTDGGAPALSSEADEVEVSVTADDDVPAEQHWFSLTGHTGTGAILTGTTPPTDESGTRRYSRTYHGVDPAHDWSESGRRAFYFPSNIPFSEWIVGGVGKFFMRLPRTSSENFVLVTYRGTNPGYWDVVELTSTLKSNMHIFLEAPGIASVTINFADIPDTTAPYTLASGTLYDQILAFRRALIGTEKSVTFRVADGAAVYDPGTGADGDLHVEDDNRIRARVSGAWSDLGANYNLAGSNVVHIIDTDTPATALGAAGDVALRGDTTLGKVAIWKRGEVVAGEQWFSQTGHTGTGAIRTGTTPPAGESGNRRYSRTYHGVDPAHDWSESGRGAFYFPSNIPFSEWIVGGVGKFFMRLPRTSTENFVLITYRGTNPGYWDVVELTSTLKSNMHIFLEAPGIASVTIDFADIPDTTAPYTLASGTLYDQILAFRRALIGTEKSVTFRVAAGAAVYDPGTGADGDLHVEDDNRIRARVSGAWSDLGANYNLAGSNVVYIIDTDTPATALGAAGDVALRGDATLGKVAIWKREGVVAGAGGG